MGVFWVRVFEVCIFPLAACNYSETGCRMQQLQTALIRFGHRSGFPDRDLRSIIAHSGSAPDSPVISTLSKKDDPCELRGRSSFRIRKVRGSAANGVDQSDPDPNIPYYACRCPHRLNSPQHICIFHSSTTTQPSEHSTPMTQSLILPQDSPCTHSYPTPATFPASPLISMHSSG